MSSRRPAPPTPLTPLPTACPPHWKRWLFDYGPALLMMGVIFVASTGVGTSAHSGWLIQHLLPWLGVGRPLSAARLESVNHYLRKAGHLTEYALLGGLLHRAAANHQATAGSEDRWSLRPVLGALVTLALYAASDEFHQRFVPTRTPSVWDVMLDIAGGTVGLGVKWAWERWRRRSSG